MIEVIIVGEGPTEEAFVRDVLAPRLAAQNIFLTPRLISTSPGFRGGALNRDRVLRFLRNTLRERGQTYVTTFFDLYGLARNFPGVEIASGIRDPIERAVTIETAFSEAVLREAHCRADRFIAHVQPYEFESLLFSDVQRMVDLQPEWKAYLEDLHQARTLAPSPEHINDGVHTHPSARLTVLRPRYRKLLHGPAAAALIGLDRIRAECLHFAAWLKRIELLSPQ